MISSTSLNPRSILGNTDGLADHPFLEPLLVQVCHEVRDSLGVDVVDPPVAKSRPNPSERDAIGLEGARGDVDPRRLPSFRQVGEGGGGRSLIHEARIGNPKGSELTQHPRLAR
jgi:hypothetical protein